MLLLRHRFGYKPEDLLGQYINALVIEPKQLEQVLKVMHLAAHRLVTRR